MNRLTKIVTDLKYWDKPDSTKMGFIPVYFKNEVRWAKPKHKAMELKVPTRAWVEKYGDGLGIYVQPDTKSGILWWTGFCLFKNNTLFEEFNDEYPNMNITHFDESWLEYFSSTEGNRRWELKSLDEDYSSLKVDIDGKSIDINNRQINGIHFDEQRTTLTEEKLIELGGFNATEPAVLGQKLQTWLNDLVTAMSSETHNVTAVGAPTGPPINLASYTSLQTRIPEIVSILVKLAK